MHHKPVRIIHAALRLLAALTLPVLPAGGAAADDLDRGFLAPPDEAKPQTWWHWMDGDISKEGITAELEAIKQIGVGGVHMFSAGHYPTVPNPKVPCLSPEWHAMVQHALKECDRLGLQFTAQNCAGWSGAGGPWITPDKGMFHVVTDKRTVAGGEILTMVSPPSWPESGKTFYHDIAVLAYPTPPACQTAGTLPAPRITSSFKNLNLDKLNDIHESEGIENKKGTVIPPVPAGHSAWIQFEFPTSVTCRAVTIAGAERNELAPPDDQRALVMASDDGQHFRNICQLSSCLSLFDCAFSRVTRAIPKTTARYFRLVWEGPATLNLRYAAWSTEPVIDCNDSKTGEAGRTLLVDPVLPTEEGTAVPPGQVIDLTKNIDEHGNLKWTAPPGAWTVARIGYTNTGRVNMPAPPEATGLECDKFDRSVVAFHFDQYIGSILKDAAAVNAKSMKGVVIDSYEAKIQNWSPSFREEFRKRRGYDVLEYLPAFAGQIVGSRDITDRFLCDVRRTGSDLISEVFYGTMTEQAHKHGLTLTAESCGGTGAGTAVADCLQHYLYVDIPMTEAGRAMKPAPSAAHLAGKKLAVMEAFTEGGGANWNDNPGSLKYDCDSFFCTGINRLTFHTYAHNSDVKRIFPGPAFWDYGMPFSRGQTWWEMGRAWISYLSRCQFLLQQGNAASDVLYFYGEDPAGPIVNVFATGGPNPDAWPALPKGFDYDLLPAEILINRLSVRDGLLVTPEGTAYRLLVLRDSDRMTPEAAKKLRELIRDGAVVMGPKPQHSPSLTDYPRCDEIVSSIGNEVWGNCDGKTVIEHAYGKGRVYWGRSVKDTLEAKRLAPDFTYSCSDANAQVRFIHRREGDSDIYFLSSLSGVDIDSSFRTSGRKPELWDAVSGKIRDAVAFHEDNGRTVVPLHFDGHGSIFVVFRKSIPSGTEGKATSNVTSFHNDLTIHGPWEVSFTPGWDAPESVTFATLDDWSKRPEEGIRHYSGTAVYHTTFDRAAPVSCDIRLDLGKVDVIAEVWLNGVSCGVAWTAPYQVDISKALKVGRNELEIHVANTWANRLIGDEQLALDKRRTWTTFHSFKKDTPLFSSGMLGPVTVQVSE